MKVWRDAWERFTPFLRFPAEIRKIVYTTNMVESVNITTTRSGTAGTGTHGWKRALNAFEIHFPSRLLIT